MKYDLIIDGKKLFSFDFPIANYIIIEDKIVIRLLSDPPLKINENVYCVNFKGELIWQMEKIKRIHEVSPITGMSFENNKLELHDGAGEDFIVDINTGKIIDSSRNWGVRPW